ncbi:MAG: monofunctional biosynthetic peptidoglycan transglycosylase [Candidatus Competibacterales bacterium]|nr:monofunctional biosynthetic peptidoglycan transglycosylase [Candidatus Competibacterales bacterium]
MNRRRRRRWPLWLLLWTVLGVLGLSLTLVLPLRWLDPPTTSFMLQFAPEDGPLHQQWVDYEMISPYMALAVVAGEDQRFPRHDGFDWGAIRQALADYRAGNPLRGASTLSQQTAKNLYLWPGRSLLRKGLEAWLTLLMEICWPKRRILEIYLNIAQFGANIFGVEAAAWHYFDKPAVALEPAEAALLAAVLPAPNRYRVAAPSEHLRRRQRWILQQMRQLGGPTYLDNLNRS